MDRHLLGYETMPVPDNGRGVDVVPLWAADAGQDWLTATGEALTSSWEAEAELDRRLGDVAMTSHTADRYMGSILGNDATLSDAIDARNQAVLQATGEQIENPMKGGYVPPAMARLQATRTAPAPYAGPTAALAAGADDNGRALQQARLDLYNSALADVARKHPNRPRLDAPIGGAAQAPHVRLFCYKPSALSRRLAVEPFDKLGDRLVG